MIDNSKEKNSNWVKCTIPDIIGNDGLFCDGDWVESKDQDPNGEIRLIQLADVGDGNFRNKSNRFLNRATAKRLNCTYLEENDILLARMPDPIGRACIFPLKGENKYVTVVDIAVIRPSKEINPKFLLYCINNGVFRSKIEQLQSGTTRKRISRGNLAQIEFYLPPLAEQHRIVAKIEELFSELDKGIEMLQTARQQLKVYRQAVLKWAFEGKLTNPELPIGQIPSDWYEKRLEDITDKITDGEHFRPKTVESGVPFLSAKDVKSNGVSFEDPLFINQETADKALKRCGPQRGDILIVSRGATVGRMCLVDTDKTFCLLGSVILIKTNSIIENKYLLYYLKSAKVNQILIKVSGATAQQAIYLRDIKSIPILLPTIIEQRLIVEEIESRLSICEATELIIDQELKKIDSVRQSILKRAFEGKLTIQDPGDEPASVLLKKIKQNGAQVGAAKIKRSKTSAL